MPQRSQLAFYYLLLCGLGMYNYLVQLKEMLLAVIAIDGATESRKDKIT